MANRVTSIIIAVLVVVMFLSGGVLGGYIVSRDIDENTEAVHALEMVIENQGASADRGRETQDLLRCLLVQFTTPPDERVDQLTPELCPEVDFGALNESQGEP
jgi:hypothetical protein